MNTITLTIESIAQGGDGVARTEQGIVAFIQGALPGERVRAHITQRKSGYLRGHVVEVLTPSPERVAPRMPESDHMPWQHIRYDAQVRFKHQIVQEQLAHTGKMPEVLVEPVIPAQHPWHYRNSAHLHVQGNNEVLGYYAAGTRRVVDIGEDPLLLPALNDALVGLRAVMHQSAWRIESVTLRGSATYGYTVALIEGSGHLDQLAQRWQRYVPSMASCVIKQGQDNTYTVSRAPWSYTTVTLHEEFGDVLFSLSPQSFFQVHTAQAETLLHVVRDMIALSPQTGRLLDAYSGVGTFTLPLAQEHAWQEVVAIEEHPQAVEDGKRTARLNGIEHVSLHMGKVEHMLATLHAPFDVAILDPPRRGCHPAALQALVALRPPGIVYISCHPGILARDMQVLIQAGYQLAKVQPVDMFPQTPHVETVCLLTMR